MIDGDRATVEEAVAVYDGQIIGDSRPGHAHSVSFPVESTDELDRIKNELSKAGFATRYLIPLDPFGDG
jgi:hypothetical protein